jgi:hypothetical protein
MTDAQLTAAILGFAQQLATGAEDRGAAEIARARNWLDASDRPTREGRWLFAALVSQRDTRSTYRLAV